MYRKIWLKGLFSLSIDSYAEKSTLYTLLACHMILQSFGLDGATV